MSNVHKYPIHIHTCPPFLPTGTRLVAVQLVEAVPFDNGFCVVNLRTDHGALPEASGSRPRSGEEMFEQTGNTRKHMGSSRKDFEVWCLMGGCHANTFVSSCLL